MFDYFFKQEAHGTHRSPEKTFKSINTYDYVITLFKTRKNYYQLYENSMVLHLNKLESLSPKYALRQVWLKLAQWSWRRGFLISSMFFRFFVIISSWKRTGPFIWRNWNTLHPRMLCAKFGWNWPSGSKEEGFFKFAIFVIISPWRVSSFEQTCIPFTKEWFVTRLVEIGQEVLEKKIF